MHTRAALLSCSLLHVLKICFVLSIFFHLFAGFAISILFHGPLDTGLIPRRTITERSMSKFTIAEPLDIRMDNLRSAADPKALLPTKSESCLQHKPMELLQRANTVWQYCCLIQGSEGRRPHGTPLQREREILRMFQTIIRGGGEHGDGLY